MPPKRKADQEKMFKIIINTQDGHEGKDDVKIGVNGKVYQIKRGFEVVIPESVLNVIRESKYTITSRDDNGNEDVRDIPRFSYTYLGEAKAASSEEGENIEEEAANDA